MSPCRDLAPALTVQVCFSYAPRGRPAAGPGEGGSAVAAAGVMVWSSSRSVIALLIALRPGGAAFRRAVPGSRSRACGGLHRDRICHGAGPEPCAILAR